MRGATALGSSKRSRVGPARLSAVPCAVLIWQTWPRMKPSLIKGLSVRRTPFLTDGVPFGSSLSTGTYAR
jgi:hypothetical protein